MNWNALRDARLRVGLLLTVTSVIFVRVLTNDFINLDDSIHIHRNPYLVDPSWSGLSELWLEPYRRLYIPFTYTVWFLLSLFGKKPPEFAMQGAEGGVFNPAIFHAANLVLHLVVSAFVVYPLLRRLSRRPLLSILGAFLFGLHPVQVEPVAWISGMKDVLSGALIFFSLKSYVDYHDAKTSQESKLCYLASLTAFALAVISKPSAIVTPALAYFIGIWFLKRSPKQVAVELATWAFLALPIIGLTIFAQADNDLEFIVPSFGHRLFNALDAVGFYLRKVLFPVRLGLDYGRGPGVTQAYPGWYWALLLLVSGILLMFCIRRRKKKPWLMGGVVLFLVPLLPVLGIKPFVFQNISTVADRYLYVSMFGISLVLVHLMAMAKRTAVPVAILSLILLGTQSFLQTGHWRNSKSIMLHSVAINPRSWLCYNNLGVVYEAEHDWQSALDAYQRSIRVREHPTIYNNLGAVYMNLQRPADALDVFRRAMVFRPHDALLLNNVGVAWLTMGKLDNAQVSFEEALVQQPDLTQARDNLHRLHQIRQGKRPSLTAGGMLG